MIGKKVRRLCFPCKDSVAIITGYDLSDQSITIEGWGEGWILPGEKYSGWEFVKEFKYGNKPEWL